MRKLKSVTHVEDTSLIDGAIRGYAGHIPGVKVENVSGCAFRSARRLSRARSVPTARRGVIPGVSGYAGHIRGRDAFQTCGMTYDAEIDFLKYASSNSETVVRDMCNWVRESNYLNASRLFESQPQKLDLNDLITSEEHRHAKEIPVVRQPMRIPGQRSIQDDRVWSYQIRDNIDTSRGAGIPSYSPIAEPTRYVGVYPKFRAGGLNVRSF